MPFPSYSPFPSKNQEILTNIGKNVRRIRKAKGLTVTALAESAGISRQTLHKIENGGGNIKVSKIYELSEALDVTPAHILEDPEKLPINDIAREWRRKQRELDQAQADK